MIQSIILTAPSAKTYVMKYDKEEGQWMFDKEGGDEILSEFWDGTYSFAVKYTDPAYNQTLYANLGGRQRLGERETRS